LREVLRGGFRTEQVIGKSIGYGEWPCHPGQDVSQARPPVEMVEWLEPEVIIVATVPSNTVGHQTPVPGHPKAGAAAGDVK
jgi:hypothetical protein